ncbi:hypothetical protein [Myxococcus sp. AB036A]|uniref:hypothetical protein n=1 Tax=Myxococcus sp. AB036A TaxID=2562793 RepID=UPI001146E359|nr:hypothetical protein [Myxococcus sp. AB036A]
MIKSLEQRLRDAEAVLARVDGATTRHAGKLAPDVEQQFKAFAAFASDIEHWIGMLAARSAARTLLAGLEGYADANDNVPLGSVRAKYQHVRLLGVQAYLATKWALADRLVGMAGHVLCARNQLQDPKNLPQLVSHFISTRGPESKTAAVAFYSLRHSFGWPIAVSYALRNHFVHDGGQLAGLDFFDGPTAGAGFKISTDGWARIEERAKSYGVNPSHYRVGAAWKPSAGDDLRAVLDVCEREMDDALGVLVGSACHSLMAHVGFVLGED